jgi:hypothetical protein
MGKLNLKFVAVAAVLVSFILEYSTRATSGYTALKLGTSLSTQMLQVDICLSLSCQLLA